MKNRLINVKVLNSKKGSQNIYFIPKKEKVESKCFQGRKVRFYKGFSDCKRTKLESIRSFGTQNRRKLK